METELFLYLSLSYGTVFLVILIVPLVLATFNFENSSYFFGLESFIYFILFYTEAL